MTIGDILSNLPEVLQEQFHRKTFEHTFESEQDVYTLVEAPVREVFDVRVGDTTYTEGTDYELVENANSPVTINGGDVALYDAIDWGVGGDSPSDGDTFVVDQRHETLLSRYLRSHDEEVAGLEDDIIDVIESHQIGGPDDIDKSAGNDLDQIGAIFGQLGERQGRSDPDYRVYLKSIVSSFSGRGSRQGLKFAIAAGVGATTADVEIVENVEELSYTVIVSNVDTSFISDAIDELADLADPSGVELDESVIVTEGNTIIIKGSSSTVTTEDGLGGEALTLDGNSTLG